CSALVLLLTVPFLLPEHALAALPERIAQVIRNRRTGAYNDGHIHLRGAAGHAQPVFQPQERRSRDHVRGRLCML
ncbi:MAG: hypothetical protein SO080_08985, partial [Oscillospiraceae bacterium]|nr:hypothetical protein [Oscillospiraceae bacterium]